FRSHRALRAKRARTLSIRSHGDTSSRCDTSRVISVSGRAAVATALAAHFGRVPLRVGPTRDQAVGQPAQSPEPLDGSGFSPRLAGEQPAPPLLAEAHRPRRASRKIPLAVTK